MKIKLLTRAAGPNWNYPAGTIVDFEKEIALKLLDNKCAIPVIEDYPSMETTDNNPEVEIMARRRGRPRKKE